MVRFEREQRGQLPRHSFLIPSGGAFHLGTLSREGPHPRRAVGTTDTPSPMRGEEGAKVF